MNKSEKKAFDEMWDIPKLYASACSNSCQLVPLQPIVISILFHHYMDLKKLMEDVKQIEEARGSSKQVSSMNEVKKEELLQHTMTATIDSYFAIEKIG